MPTLPKEQVYYTCANSNTDLNYQMSPDSIQCPLVFLKNIPDETGVIS
jgi:hypothetical protein